MQLNYYNKVREAMGNRIDKIFLKDEMGSSRRNIIFSTYATGAAGNLIGGTFLTGFLLLLDADDAFIGLVTMIMLAGNLIQVISPILLERFSSRKQLLIYIRIAMYVFNIILMGLIPYAGVSQKIRLAAIIVIQVFISIFNAVSAPGFAIWHIQSIPEDTRARYYSMLSVTNTIFIYVLILLASLIADRFKEMGNALQGLLLLRIIALVFMVIDVYFLFKVKEYPNNQDIEAARISDIMMSFFKEKKYLLTVLVSCLYSFSANFAGPFYSIYLLKDLGISYSYLNTINLLNIPIIILLSPFWAKRIQRTSWLGTFSLSLGLYSLSNLGLAFVSAKTISLYPVIMFIVFVLAPGINIVYSNLPFIHIPQYNQTRYVGFFLTMTSLAGLIALFLGRRFILFTSSFKFRLLGMDLQNKQYILLITFFLMLLSSITIFYIRRYAQENPATDRRMQ